MAYYMTDMPLSHVGSWVAAGSPEQVVRHLKVLEELGFDEITLRITSWDQEGQLARVINEILPHFQ